MSFGQSGGFSFGANNNTTQSSGFGFGSNNPTGFAGTSNTGFGSTSTSTNPFSTASTGFGSGSGGAFGSTNTNTPAANSLFGQKNPFSSAPPTGTSGLFGNTANSTSAFGSGNTTGFGNAANNSSGFGANSASGNNTGSLFGNTGTSTGFGNKPATGSLFGQGGLGTTTSFGASFGNNAGTGTALNQQPVPPAEGTAVLPFAPTNEKETGSAITNSFQSIVFQQPYQKYSFEELRMADYNANRRFGNGSGQSGAFGQSTFGGGFGSNSTTGGLFGNQQSSTPAPFGSGSSSSPFGGGASNGGLFGNKSAGTGLFGQASSSGTTGGLFGTANPATSNPPFGGGSTGFGGTASSGGLFGNQGQSKPGGLFGSGSGTNTGGGLFGSGPGNNTSGGGLFGSSNPTSTNPNPNPFGGSTQQATGGGGFGFGSTSTQAKPTLFGTSGGLGGSTTAGGGLFGGGSNPGGASSGGGLFGSGTGSSNPAAGSLFGSNPSTATGGGLFGSGSGGLQQKPGGLFGGGLGTSSGSTSGGLFGSNPTVNQGQSQGGGLFGGASSGSLFGGQNPINNINQQPNSGSLFGATTNTAGGFGMNNNNSLFGNPQNGPNNQQQQNGIKNASVTDNTAHGQSSIWTGLPVHTPENTAPLLTPLSAAQRLAESKARPSPRSTLKPRYGTFNTPMKNSYGFSYSNYGTPNSAASTPGLGGLGSSMYGQRFTGGAFPTGSFGRSVSRSLSTSNLGSQYRADVGGVLTPSAFSQGNLRHSDGSIRRLHIDRSLRNDLFSPRMPPPLPTANGTPTNGNNLGPPAPNGDVPADQGSKLKKRVSFDKDTTGGTPAEELNGSSGALVRTEEDDDEAMDEQQPARGRRGKTTNGSSTVEMEQVRGNELAMVPEDRESDSIVPTPQPNNKSQAGPDPEPGDYWMKPSRAEIKKVARDQQKRFQNFQVGRNGCGHVTFNGPVDLTTLPLDEVYDKIVEIRVRSITVYPDPSMKPDVGKGLNVPSTLYIENSWPRAHNKPSSATSGPIFDKHVSRLKKIAGTEFVDYVVNSGVWIFQVPHFTRYGLDYDEDDADADADGDLGPSVSSLPPNASTTSTPQTQPATPDDSSAEEDTFAFKQHVFVPGGFGHRSTIEIEDDEDDLPIDDALVPLSEDSDDVEEHEMDMAGSYPDPHAISFLPPVPVERTPAKLLDLDGEWEEQLRRTISPRKQDRAVLREMQSRVLLDQAYEPIQPKPAVKDFRNSMDVMNSLFGEHQARVATARKQKSGGPDFELPYAKRAKTFDPTTSTLSPADRQWHDSFKPRWTATGQLIYADAGEATRGGPVWREQLLVDDTREVVLSSMSTQNSLDLPAALRNTRVTLVDGVPLIHHLDVPFSDLRRHLSDVDDSLESEDTVYELAHVLFDDYEDEFTVGLTSQQQKPFQYQILKDRLTNFISSRVWKFHHAEIHDAEKTRPEEAAILHLTAKNVSGACHALMSSKDYHLMMLVAQIEQADDSFQNDMELQIVTWRDQNIISEMSEPIRALYEILAGNTTRSEGQARGPVEDQASSFSISHRFHLDWLQAFGLCLWYGKQKHQTVEDVVVAFVDMLQSGAELRRPDAQGRHAKGHESPLWVLLTLYASTKKDHFAAPVLPQALEALVKPFDSAAAFRFHQALVSRLPKLKAHIPTAKRLAHNLAFELSAQDDLVGAIYALLHLPDANEREANVKDVLVRHAADLPELSARDTDGGSWNILTKQLKVPTPWIYEAKALHARSQTNPIRELRYLILADKWQSAHECFCLRVAPRAIIDEDGDMLQHTLALFGDGPESKVADWAHGGGIYTDFVTALQNKASTETIQRLQASLSEMGRRFKSRGKSVSSTSEELEERVACSEMAGMVADMLSGPTGGEILDLPLTADKRSVQTKAVALSYYQATMATAK